MVQRYEPPPWLFLTLSNGSPFFGFSILAASHKLVHHPQLAFVTKLLPCGLALHAPAPCHGLFSLMGLNNRQQHTLTGSRGGRGQRRDNNKECGGGQGRAMTITMTTTRGQPMRRKAALAVTGSINTILRTQQKGRARMTTTTATMTTTTVRRRQDPWDSDYTLSFKTRCIIKLIGRLPARCATATHRGLMQCSVPSRTPTPGHVTPPTSCAH
jgi:hypothetical protein